MFHKEGGLVMFQALKKMFGGKKEQAEVLSPAAGKVIPLSEVADPAFAQGILGKGVALIPSEGAFRAPVSGEVTVLFETGHAVSIKADNGAELIVHIGLDTVQLKGQYFQTHVKQGDRVQVGDLLITADLEQIRTAGYDVVTPVIVCNTPDFPDMVCSTGMVVKAGDPLISL